MTGLSVVAVQTRAQKKQFFRLPWQLYQGDPNWVPPLRTNQLELLNYKPHPFYRLSRIQTFVALQDGRPVGRIAAILNQGHLDRYQDNRGFFGFYECVNEQAAADALLSAARDWLREQGVDHIFRPRQPVC